MKTLNLFIYFEGVEEMFPIGLQLPSTDHFFSFWILLLGVKMQR